MRSELENRENIATRRKIRRFVGAFGLECMKFARVEEEASGISGRYSEPGTRPALPPSFSAKSAMPLFVPLVLHALLLCN